MKKFILLTLLVVIAQFAIGLPVTKQDEKKPEEEQNHHDEGDVADSLEYERYLKEVINVLETDPEFRKKLDNATDVDIRSAKIANELEHVNHHVRSKLDEIKRREIERLRQLAIKQYELTNDIDREHLKISDPKHVDHDNPHTFEIEDLKKLILKTSEDLAEADKKRRDEFKEYELQKEFEKREKMREMDEEHRRQYEEELKKQQVKHNKHDKIHHPGNKAQLEEVWEKQDHMDANDFNPKTFFMMHDLDGNNFWDPTEVKALFVKELDKVYQSGLPEDDMRERVEEMERMREHVFQEADTNHDNLISLEEFIAQTKREEFNRDPNWETVDNQPQFTHEEYLEFERQRRVEIDRLIAQGMLPPHPNMPNGYYPDHGYQGHPNGIPQGQHYPQQPGQQAQYQYQQQPMQYQYQQQQGNGQYQQHPNAVPNHGNVQYQNHPNAVPNQGNVQYQQHPNAVPNQGNVQYQQHPNAVPNQGNVQYQNNPNAHVPNAQIPNGQVPSGQVANGQVPNGQVPNAQNINSQVPNSQIPNAPNNNNQGQFNPPQGNVQANQAYQPPPPPSSLNQQPNTNSGQINQKQEQLKQQIPSGSNPNAINTNDKH